jgi:hypothetical protein
MGFRFRKSIKLMPGVRLNIGKSGVSASVGIKGASVNLGKRGARGTVGIPGTGISYSANLTSIDNKQQGLSSQALDSGVSQSRSKASLFFCGLILVALAGLLFSCISN